MFPGCFNDSHLTPSISLIEAENRASNREMKLSFEVANYSREILNQLQHSPEEQKKSDDAVADIYEKILSHRNQGAILMLPGTSKACNCCKATFVSVWKPGPEGRNTLCGPCYSHYRKMMKEGPFRPSRK